MPGPRAGTCRPRAQSPCSHRHGEGYRGREAVRGDPAALSAPRAGRQAAAPGSTQLHHPAPPSPATAHPQPYPTQHTLIHALRGGGLTRRARLSLAGVTPAGRAPPRGSTAAHPGLPPGRRRRPRATAPPAPPGYLAGSVWLQRLPRERQRCRGQRRRRPGASRSGWPGGRRWIHRALATWRQGAAAVSGRVEGAGMDARRAEPSACSHDAALRGYPGPLVAPLAG